MKIQSNRKLLLRNSATLLTGATLTVCVGLALATWQPRASAQNPSNSATIQRLRSEAEQFSAAGKYEKAVERYRRIATIQPSATAYADLAQILESAGHSAEAAKAAEATLRMDPNMPAAHRLLGTFDSLKGQYASAIAHYQAALRNSAPDRNTLWGLGTALFGAQKWSEAEQAFAKAITAGPPNSDDVYDLRVRRGLALYRLGQRSAAIQEWNQVPLIPRSHQPVPVWQKNARTLIEAMTLLGEEGTDITAAKPPRVAHR